MYGFGALCWFLGSTDPPAPAGGFFVLGHEGSVKVRRLPDGPEETSLLIRVKGSSVRQRTLEGKPIESSQSQTLACLQKSRTRRPRGKKRRK